MADKSKQIAARQLMDKNFVGPPSPDSLEYKFQENLLKLGKPEIKDGMIDLGAENIRRSEIFAGGDKKKAALLRESAKQAKIGGLETNQGDQGFYSPEAEIEPSRKIPLNMNQTIKGFPGLINLLDPVQVEKAENLLFNRGETTQAKVGNKFGATKIFVSPFQSKEEIGTTLAHEITHGLNPGYGDPTNLDQYGQAELGARLMPALKAMLAAKYGSVASDTEKLAEQVKGLSKKERALFKQTIEQKFFNPKPIQQVLSESEKKFRNQFIQKIGREPEQQDYNELFIPLLDKQQQQQQENMQMFDSMGSGSPSQIDEYLKSIEQGGKRTKMLQSISKAEKPDFNKTIT